MNKFWILLSAVVAAGSLWADSVALGNLQLNSDGYYQDISLYNLTGGTQGCQANGPQYSVCNGVDISSWQLTVYFTNENLNSLSSPLTFTSGSSDTIGPFYGSNPYIGGSTGTWLLPLNSDPEGCPPCDYQITQVVFSGTISPADMPFRLGNGLTYDSGNPSTYTVFNPEATFSTTWNVPIVDYDSGVFLFDSTDILVNEELTVQTTTPEITSLGLLGSVMALIILAQVWRTRRRLSR